MTGLLRLGPWVDGAAEALRLRPSVEYALRLCVEEAATNVVMHGALDRDDAEFVALRVEVRPETLLVTVEDRCGAFDPLTVPSPEPPGRLEDAKIGGLGIHLMRQYASAIRYERDGGVNRLILTIPQRQGGTG